MTYVIRSDAKLRRKSGEVYVHTSYFKGQMFGFMNEFTGSPAEAKKFRTKALAEINIRNRFSGRKGMTAEKVKA